VSVRIGDHVFEQVSYDDDGDVLYLKNDDHGSAVSTFGTAEGHAVRVDSEGKVVGMTIVNAKWLIERDGKVVISIPQQRIEAPAKDLGVAVQRSVSK